MSPLETNARKLIELVVQRFPLGARAAELERQFAKDAGLRRQSFFYALRFAREQGWLVKDQGHLYQLDPRGSWRQKSTELGAEPALSRDQLEYLADARGQKIAELENQIAHVRDWASGSNSNGVALRHLLQVITDSDASTRQKLKACATLFAYRVDDASVVEFVQRYLEGLCGNPAVATDYRLEAAELLRKRESPRVLGEIVRSNSGEGEGRDRREAWRNYQRWALRRRILIETRSPPPEGWDAHLVGDSYEPPEGAAMPPVDVVRDPVSGYRVITNLFPDPKRKRNFG